MLILAATPIGNLGDASPRLCEALREAAVIAAEDTRKTRQLLQLLEIDTAAKLVSLHDHNERAKASEIAELAAAQQVVVVSDAGMPTVSDPGFRVVAAAVQADVQVSVIPGPSAPLAALAVSGLPSNRFAFEGFLPKKPGEISSALQRLKTDDRTLIFFESPRRLRTTLTHMSRIFGGDRQAAVCRELTKRYEEVLRGTIDDLLSRLTEELKGEIVIVVGGAKPVAESPAQALAEVLDRVASGERLKDASRAVAATSGISSRELYESANALKHGNQHGFGSSHFG